MKNTKPSLTYHTIKFLKGYGFSIKQHQNKITLTDGADPFTGEKKSESHYITELPYDKIVYSGDGYVSTKAIQLLLSNNVHLIQTDTFGNLIVTMSTPDQSKALSKWRKGQYDTFANPEKKLKLQKHWIAQKIASQIRLFQYIQSDAKKSIKQNPEIDDTISKLESYLSKYDSAKNKLQLDSIESHSSKIYFDQFAKLIPERFAYSTRNNGLWNNPSKENPTNVINAFLNYGYSVLASTIAKYLHVYGLDPYYGFNHKQGFFMSLVYDVIEPFRVLVDGTVLQMANSKAGYYGYIHKKKYRNSVKGIVLEKSLIESFLQRLDNTMNRKRPYKVTRGRRSYKLGYEKSHAQEYTIMKEEIWSLANYCRT